MAEMQHQQAERTIRQVQVLLPPSVAGDPNAEIVGQIVRALRAHPATRAALEAAGEAASGAPEYVALSRMGEEPPPVGVPFYNDAIGVLSVPAPAEDAVRAVREALRDVAPDADVVEETTYHTQ